MLCPVPKHLILEIIKEFFPVLRFMHVDEIDYNDSTHIAKAQLTGDLFGGFHIDHQCVLILIFSVSRAIATIHINYMKGFRMFNYKICSSRKVHCTSECRLNLLFNTKMFKNGLFPAIMLHNLIHFGRDFVNISPYFFIKDRILDMNICEISIEDIPQNG